MQHRPNRNTSLKKIPTIFKPKIINLCTYKFGKNQIDLSKLGLNFCPTPKRYLEEIKKDFKEFVENLDW